MNFNKLLLKHILRFERVRRVRRATSHRICTICHTKQPRRMLERVAGGGGWCCYDAAECREYRREHLRNTYTGPERRLIPRDT